MRAVMALLLIAGCAGILCSCGEEPPADQMVDIGTHQLLIHREGRGSPAVVIDVGIGDSPENWGPLQERLSKETQVCTYYRAGYGRSQAGPVPRHSGQVADELRALLGAASVAGPYVLVGHSLGALNMQVFADRYPDAVAGMVLLDPPPLSFIQGKNYPKLQTMASQMTAEWQGIAVRGAGSDDPEERARAQFFKTIASEHHEMFGESARLAGAIESFGDVPLVVIASGRSNPVFGDVAEEYQRYWAEESKAVAMKSSKGRFILAQESSHNLYADEPDLVIESILDVVAQCRGR